MVTAVGEELEVHLGVESRERPQVAEGPQVRLGRGEIGEGGVGGGVRVVGYLQSERASVGEVVEQSVDDVEVVGHPLEHRVGDHQVDRPVRRPLRDVGGVVVGMRIGVVADRAIDHLRRIVDAQDLRRRPACPKVLGEMTRSATQVDHRQRVGRDLCDEVEKRTRTDVSELQIACRVPHNHDSTLTVSLRSGVAAAVGFPA